MKMGRGIEMKEVARKMAKEVTGECARFLIYLPAFPFSMFYILGLVGVSFETHQ